jgi:hypothetical protein
VRISLLKKNKENPKSATGLTLAACIHNFLETSNTHTHKHSRLAWDTGWNHNNLGTRQAFLQSFIGTRRPGTRGWQMTRHMGRRGNLSHIFIIVDFPKKHEEENVSKKRYAHHTTVYFLEEPFQSGGCLSAVTFGWASGPGCHFALTDVHDSNPPRLLAFQRYHRAPILERAVKV